MVRVHFIIKYARYPKQLPFLLLIFILFNSLEEHLLLVRDIKRPTLFAEDVVSQLITSKSLDALLADTPMLKWEDVQIDNKYQKTA